MGFLLIAACLGVVQFSIFVAQTTFAAAVLVWLVVVLRERRPLDLPAFFVPLVMGIVTLALAYLMGRMPSDRLIGLFAAALVAVD